MKSDKCSAEWKRIKTLPTTVVRIGCDTNKKISGNVNRW